MPDPQSREFAGARFEAIIDDPEFPTVRHPDYDAIQRWFEQLVESRIARGQGRVFVIGTKGDPPCQ